MNGRPIQQSNIGLAHVMLLCALVILMACGTPPARETTSIEPYSALIGARYEIETDDVNAYGVAQSMEKTLSWITLMPGPGISGSQILFRRHVPKGTVIQITSAWRQPVLFSNGDYYLVTVHPSNLPTGVPVRLELAYGNEGDKIDLNRRIYRRLVGSER